MKNFLQLCLICLLIGQTFITKAATFKGSREDFRDETIYFAMTTRFYDGDPTNNVYCWDGVKNINDPEWRGDFKGLIEKLDYIKALGFTAVWITPVVENASGLDYHGYHAFDFSKVDPRYESKDVKFQTLIDEVHKRGMKLILDIVLQHTGNFGEANLCPMFVKDYSKNLSNINKSMKLAPNTKLPSNYFSLDANSQYSARLGLMKNTQGKNEDSHNYWHHVGNNWGWDDYSRVWGQIAGDCVDLNTENPAVTNYLVKCYSNFIKMGVDGFRIDTSGHIARLSFNKAFIPQFIEASKTSEAISKRGNTPFFMFGEVCARAEEVIYRNENYNCSPCFYTWAETKNYQWDESETSWDKYVVMEGDFGDHVNAQSVLQQGKDYAGCSDAILQKSNNAWLNGNEYHTPDYTKSSNFNVIDFPMHWRFHNAENAFRVNTQDNLYNDATWNVVYVDGHDYGPNGYNLKSFNGSLEAWAENLSLMFTFRGIPCIFQGTECYFRKGSIIDEGANKALKETCRAYYGGYITGSVNTTDFGEFTNATGNLKATLSHPLAIHITRLNKIRAAIPALRKGQYSTSGCSGKMAFKRRYTDSATDSYVLVTISGDATFSNILNGRYVDVVTGDVQTVTNNSLTAKCSGQGNLRVYVLDNQSQYSQIGSDTQFAYKNSSVKTAQASYDGQQEAEDTQTKRDTESYDPSKTACVELSPNGGSFKSETLVINIKLSDDAVAGWYSFEGGSKVNLTKGVAAQLTIGSNMKYGDEAALLWGATDESGETFQGKAIYKKIDPSASITVYVTASSAPYLYAWVNETTKLNGNWPGQKMTSTVEIGNTSFYYQSFDGVESFNIIFNDGNGSQTDDINNISQDTYFSYDGGKGFKRSTDPNDFDNSSSGNPGDGSISGSYVIYFDNSNSNWNPVYAYLYGGVAGNDYIGGWPGRQMQKDSATGYYCLKIDSEYDLTQSYVIFNNGGNGKQTKDNVYLVNFGIYDASGYTGKNVELKEEKPGDDNQQDENNSDDSTPGEDNNAGNNNGEVSDSQGNGNSGNDNEGASDNGKDTEGDTDSGNQDGSESEENNPGTPEQGNGNSGENSDDNGSGSGNSEGDKTEDSETDPKPGDEIDDTGVDTMVATGEIEVWVSEGKIYVEVSRDMDIFIVRIDGSYHMERMFAGVNVIEGLPHGLYIINGRKVML